MHWFMLLLLATLIVGGYYAYQRLRKIEREIRDEQNLSAVDAEAGVPADTPKVVQEPVVTVQPEATDEVDLSSALLGYIALHAGLSQPEIYDHFIGNDRRELQKCLRDLAQAGRLRREKTGSSYRLYPV